jgi:hypothetical protein
MSVSDYKPPVLMPMNMADLIDAAIRLYRRNFGPFVGIVAVVYVPIAVVQAFLVYSVGQMANIIPDNPADLNPATFIGLGGAYLGMFLLYGLAVPLSQGALAVAVSRRYLGYPATVADSYGAIGRRWGVLIAAVLLTGLCVGVGMMLCLAPGVYLAVMWLFVTPVIAVEGRSVMDALRRSWDLVAGEWWRCFGTYLLLNLLVGLVGAAISYPVTGIAVVLMSKDHMALAQGLSSGISTALSLFVQPVLIIGLVLLYFDMRIRKEGFDLQVLAQAMNVPASEIPTYEAYVQAAPVAGYVPGAPLIPPELLDYVQQAQAAGMSYEEARKDLIAGGWPASQVERDLPYAWAQPAAPPAATFPAPEPAPESAASALEPPVIGPPPAITPLSEPDPFAPDAPSSDHTTEQP